MCSPSPVASKCWHDSSARWGSRVTYLGIIGDQAHQTRVSGHNCAPLQESSVKHPDTGVTWSYPGAYAHALDVGHGGDRALATEIRNAWLADPLKRVRYVIDNGVIYYPAWRGGGTGGSSGHTTHVHVSFTPWATHDIREWYKPKAKPVSFPLKRGDKGFAVVILEIHLVHCGFPNVRVDGKFGLQTTKAVAEMQKFLKRRKTGKVTKGDFEAIANWVNFAVGDKPEILTIGDNNPRVTALRKNLHKIGQDVKPRGGNYTSDVQVAVQNVQRYFKLRNRAGNATKADRAFIKMLADRKKRR